jgi:hypothetical protein
MVILAPLAVTAVYAVLLALAFMRALRQVDPMMRTGGQSLEDMWRGGLQKRILTLGGVFLALALIGGIVGSEIAFHRGDTTFAALAWASFLGQVTLIVAAVVVSALIRRFITMRGMRP